MSKRSLPDPTKFHKECDTRHTQQWLWLYHSKKFSHKNWTAFLQSCNMQQKETCVGRGRQVTFNFSMQNSNQWHTLVLKSTIQYHNLPESRHLWAAQEPVQEIGPAAFVAQERAECRVLEALRHLATRSAAFWQALAVLILAWSGRQNKFSVTQQSCFACRCLLGWYHRQMLWQLQCLNGGCF